MSVSSSRGGGPSPCRWRWVTSAGEKYSFFGSAKSYFEK